MVKKKKDMEDKTNGLKESVKNRLAPKKERLHLYLPTSSPILDYYLAGKLPGGFTMGKVANIIGNSSAGKCLKNATILTENGFELIDTIGKNKPFGLSEYTETLAISKNKTDQTSHFWKEKVNQTIKIRTRHGFELEGTPDHPILIFTSDFKIKFRKLKDLKVNDTVIIGRGTQTFSTTYPKLINTVQPSSSQVKMILPDMLTTELARLLGYFIADGSFARKNKIIIHATISNSKKYIHEDLKHIFKTLGIDKLKHNYEYIPYAIATIIYQFCGKPKKFTARYKFVPDCILQAPKDIQTNFLQALFDCNSWGNDRELSYYTASEKLSNQIQLMLLNLGIISTRSFKSGAFDGKTYHDHKYWKVSIYGQDLLIYKKEIQSNKYEFTRTKFERRSDYDTIPNLVIKIKNDLNILKEKIDWNKNGIYGDNQRFPHLNFSQSPNCSFTFLKKFIRKFKNLPIDLTYYKNILQSKNHFDTIKKITYQNESSIVFDVHIPKTHSFWSNGFISHNSIFCKTLLAEAANNPTFDDYALISDDTEFADEFDDERLFGKKMAKRVQGPKTDKSDAPIASESIEELYQNFLVWLDSGQPFIYVADSLDAIKSKEDETRAIQFKKSGEASGTYGQSKPKLLSEMLRVITGKIKKTNSLIIIVSQVRDKMNVMFGRKEDRTGGRALTFYCTYIIWLRHLANIPYKISDKLSLDIGSKSLVDITKNKFTGKRRKSEIHIYDEIGVDALTPCIDFLISQKLIKKDGLKYTFEDLNAKKKELVKQIEQSPKHLKNLYDLVNSACTKLDAKVSLNRKNRYE